MQCYIHTCICELSFEEYLPNVSSQIHVCISHAESCTVNVKRSCPLFKSSSARNAQPTVHNWNTYMHIPIYTHTYLHIHTGPVIQHTTREYAYIHLIYIYVYTHICVYTRTHTHRPHHPAHQSQTASLSPCTEPLQTHTKAHKTTLRRHTNSDWQRVKQTYSAQTEAWQTA
jgi:hypothetical protein